MILSVLRIFDALNDPITGLVIDNIRSPWGKFKPAILVGGILSAVFFVLLFANIGTGWVFVISFGLAYLLWDIAYGINDIGYWTLLPAMSSDQKQREKTGTFARICANIGMYIVMVAWQPVTSALGGAISTGFVSLTLLLSGIKIDGGTVDAIDASGKLIFKSAMFALPLVFILVGYVVYLKKYKIDEQFYGEILQDLESK